MQRCCAGPPGLKVFFSFETFFVVFCCVVSCFAVFCRVLSCLAMFGRVLSRFAMLWSRFAVLWSCFVVLWSSLSSSSLPAGVKENFFKTVQNKVTHNRGSLFRTHLARRAWVTIVGHLWVTLRFLCVGHFCAQNIFYMYIYICSYIYITSRYATFTLL